MYLLFFLATSAFIISHLKQKEKITKFGFQCKAQQICHIFGNINEKRMFGFSNVLAQHKYSYIQQHQT